MAEWGVMAISGQQGENKHDLQAVQAACLWPPSPPRVTAQRIPHRAPRYRKIVSMEGQELSEAVIKEVRPWGGHVGTKRFCHVCGNGQLMMTSLRLLPSSAPCLSVLTAETAD